LRHGIAVTAMVVMIAGFAATLATSVAIVETRVGSMTLNENAVADTAISWKGQTESWKVLLPWLSAAWVLGVLILAGYRAGGW